MTSDNFKNLNELYEAMKCGDPRTLDRHGQFRADLPYFVDGDQAPGGTLGVWSWDQDSMIAGTCVDDLEIVRREDVPMTTDSIIIAEFPERVNTMHDPEDMGKVAEIAESIHRSGWHGRPLLLSDVHGAIYAWTGTHRIAAIQRLADEGLADEVTVPIIWLDEPEAERLWLAHARYDETVAQMRELGFEMAADLLELEMAQGK